LKRLAVQRLRALLSAGGQLMIRSGGLSGGRQQWRKMTLELLQQFPVVKLIFTERCFGVVSNRDHATSKPQQVPGVQ
jgi:hypothetical protein